MSKRTSLMVMGYAVCVAAGGIAGYLLSGSSPSLIAGLSSGGILSVAAILLWMNQRLGLFIALTLSLTLGLFFSYRFAQSQSFMPSGLMMLLSFLTATLLLASQRQKKPKQATD